MPHPHNHHYHCGQKSWDSQQAAAVAESQSLVEDPVRASQGVSLETLFLFLDLSIYASKLITDNIYISVQTAEC